MLHGGDARSLPSVLVRLPLPVLGDGEELLAVEVGAVERADRSGVVEERVGVVDDRLEGEVVGDVGLAVAVVVDVDAVQHVVAELEEVGAARRILERDVVGDDRDGVGPIGADERVGVGAVGDGILGDLGRLTV